MNVVDFQANEIPTEFFLSMAYDTVALNRNNLLDFYANVAQRESQAAPALANKISAIVSTFSCMAAIRKPVLTTPAASSMTNYREADTYIAQRLHLLAAAEHTNRRIPRAAQGAFFQHPVGLRALCIASKKNGDLTSQASAANAHARPVGDVFDMDWALRET